MSHQQSSSWIFLLSSLLLSLSAVCFAYDCICLDCPDSLRTWTPFEDEEINEVFDETFNIYVNWNPANSWQYPENWTAQTIIDFANTVFPESEPEDPKTSPAHFIANYWGKDENTDYEGIAFRQANGDTVITEFDIYLDKEGDWSTGGNQSITLRAWTELDPDPVEAMVYDAFVHEFQHVAWYSVPNEDGRTFGGYPDDYDTGDGHANCNWHNDATTEFFSKASEWLYTDVIEGEHEFAHAADFPMEPSLARDDYWEICQLGNVYPHGTFRYVTFGLFAAYLQDHFELGEAYSEQLLFAWRHFDPDENGLHEVDFWSLGEIINTDDYDPYFDSEDADPRVRELYQDYTQSVWCNNAGIGGSSTVWVDDKNPQDEFGIFMDWNEDEWCIQDVRTFPLYNVVAELDELYEVEHLISSNDYPDCECTNECWERVFHIDSYSFLALPFIADDELDTDGDCAQLEISIDFQGTYNCIDPNSCTDEIANGSQDHQTIEVELTGNEVLHIDVFGYPEASDALDRDGSDAELLFSIEESEFTDVEDIGDDGSLQVTVPCFGSTYKAIVLLMTLTELSATEGEADAAILPFSYTYQAEALQTANVSTNTEWSAACACLNNHITVSAGATLTIGAGTMVRYAEGEPKIALLAASGQGGVVSIEGEAEAPVTFMPVTVDDEWGGFTLQAAADLYAWHADLGKFLAINTYAGYQGGQTVVELEDCTMELAAGGMFQGPAVLNLSNARTSNLARCVIDESKQLSLGTESALQDVTINVASSYTGVALEMGGIYGGTLQDVIIDNAKNGISISYTQQGQDIDLGGVEIHGRGQSATIGLEVYGAGDVTMTESAIEGFEKACKIDESPSVIMRDTSFTDIDAEGVLVISGYDGGGIDLGSSTPNDGNNCIASTGYRVSNLEDGVEVQAEYNFWGDYPADEDWFNGDVNWDDALADCPLDLGGYFYLGQVASSGGSEPAALRLTGAYPNPFNPRCCIEFRLPDSPALASLEIFDLSGRLVKRLFAGECDGKEHTLIWKGDSDQSDPVGSGVYFARVHAGDETDTLKLVVLR